MNGAPIGSVVLKGNGALREKVFVNRLYRAYLALALIPKNEDGSRTVPIARLGSFEVRIVESSSVGASNLQTVLPSPTSDWSRFPSTSP
jgi:hypothetical protein